MTSSEDTSNNLPAQDKQSEEVIWDYAFPLLTNPFVMLDMCKALGITFVVVCGILLIIGAFQGGSNFGDMLNMIPLMALCVGIVAVIMVFVMLVLYRNRFPARFTVNHEGATIEVSRTQRKLNTAVIILGCLAGKPGVAGSGFLARAQERQFFGWVDVFKLELFPGRRVVVLRNGWRTVARLYCTSDNYEAAARIATEGVERTKRDRESNAVYEKKSRSQLVRDIFNRWLIIGIISVILATASPLLENVGLFFAVGGALLLGFATGRQVRWFFGVVALLMLVGIVFLMAIEGAKVHSFAGGYIKFSNFESATRGDNLKLFIISVFGMLGLIACSVRNIIACRK